MCESIGHRPLRGRCPKAFEEIVEKSRFEINVMMVFQQDNLGISIPKLGPLSSVFVIVGLRAREQMIST